MICDIINSILIFIDEYYNHIFNKNTVNVTSTGGMNAKNINRDRDNVDVFNFEARKFLVGERIMDENECL
jgi:hypothetical protein